METGGNKTGYTSYDLRSPNQQLNEFLLIGRTNRKNIDKRQIIAFLGNDSHISLVTVANLGFIPETSHDIIVERMTFSNTFGLDPGTKLNCYMMEIEIYQVDAFCKERFSGNPAAVCPLTSWPADELMQQIAAENNLSETAFYVPEGAHYHIRWFTPTVEVDLCGHATLATAHVLYNHKGFTGDTIKFTSRSGELRVKKTGDFLTLDFPADTLTPIAVTDDMYLWFDKRPEEAYKGKTDYMLVFADEADIANLQPNFAVIQKLTDARGVIATAPGASAKKDDAKSAEEGATRDAAKSAANGDAVDFVSRFFGPQSGVPEDPVTGSAHTTLTPYWSKRLGKKDLTAQQLSARKGFLQCKDAGNRIEISGKAKTFLAGRLHTS
jgi:PhzF family phenazine biosynthesis protein